MLGCMLLMDFAEILRDAIAREPLLTNTSSDLTDHRLNALEGWCRLITYHPQNIATRIIARLSAKHILEQGQQRRVACCTNERCSNVTNCHLKGGTQTRKRPLSMSTIRLKAVQLREFPAGSDRSLGFEFAD
jgi:hypothetical protein